MVFIANFLGSALGIILIIILLILIVAYLLVRNFRMSGIGNLINALRQSLENGEIQERMAQPRSVNGMDRIYVPLIKQAYPQINIEELRDQAEVLLLSMFEALEQKDLDKLYGAGPTYTQQVKQIITDMEAAGQSLIFEAPKIHKTVISMFKDSANSSEITFQTALEARVALIDQDGVTVQGDTEGIVQLRFDQSLIYIVDPNLYMDTSRTTLSVNCPNCGGPVSFKNDVCPYCGTYNTLIPIRVWIFSNFKNS